MVAARSRKVVGKKEKENEVSNVISRRNRGEGVSGSLDSKSNFISISSDM